MTNSTFNIGDKVNATITKNGYFMDSYMGRVAGFTKNGLIKVSTSMGTKCHAVRNVVLIEPAKTKTA